MPKFEGSRGRRDSRGNSSRRSNSRDRGSFEGRSRGRRDSRGGRGRGEVQRTKVTCSSCGVECEVPFKPSSDKPVYCDNCFSKQNKGSSGRSSNSNKNLDIINEKLDKIMKALKIE